MAEQKESPSDLIKALIQNIDSRYPMDELPAADKSILDKIREMKIDILTKMILIDEAYLATKDKRSVSCDLGRLYPVSQADYDMILSISDTRERSPAIDPLTHFKRYLLNNTPSEQILTDLRCFTAEKKSEMVSKTHDIRNVNEQFLYLIYFLLHQPDITIPGKLTQINDLLLQCPYGAGNPGSFIQDDFRLLSVDKELQEKKFSEEDRATILESLITNGVKFGVSTALMSLPASLQIKHGQVIATLEQRYARPRDDKVSSAAATFGLFPPPAPGSQAQRQERSDLQPKEGAESYAIS